MEKPFPLNDEQNRHFISSHLAEQGLRVLHEFTTATSFQIRTPLMVIIGYSDLILSGKTGPLNEKQKERLTYLRHSAGDLLPLIDEIKKFKEKTPTKKQPEQPVLFTSDIRDFQYFLSGIVHKLRAPLTVISGSSAFLLSSPQTGFLNEVQRDYLASIHSIGEELLEIVNELLDVYYLSFRWFEVEVEEVEVSQLIQETISITLEHWIVGKRPMKPVIAPNLAGQLPPVWADRRSIQQAITQLLLETIRTLPDDEQSEILLTVSHEAPRITFRINARGQSKVVSFDDHNPRLFFSRCIIEMHRGQLQLEKQEKFEAAIAFSLPAGQRKALIKRVEG